MAGPLTQPILDALPEVAVEYDPRWDEIDERPMHYDREGYPITIREWLQLFDYKPYQVVLSTLVYRYRVSTVWLGLDHGFGESPPIIFETMVFEGNTPPKTSLFSEQVRYCTEEEAQKGHREMVEEIKLLAETYGEKP